MVKALPDQATQVDVFNAALSSLGGTAQQVAEQTFGGQWQQLANAWEQIMVQVGQAILPVVSDLVQFTKTDILPFVKEMVSDFNALPGPVKDAAVAVALLVAADNVQIKEESHHVGK
jgi:TP901 family phage tail tape measure protein